MLSVVLLAVGGGGGGSDVGGGGSGSHGQTKATNRSSVSTTLLRMIRLYGRYFFAHVYI